MDLLAVLLAGLSLIISVVNAWLINRLEYEVRSVCVELQSVARKAEEPANRLRSSIMRAEEKLEDLVMGLVEAGENVTKLAGEAHGAAERIRRVAEKLGKAVNAAERLYSSLEEATQLAASAKSEAQEVQREIAKLKSVLHGLLSCGCGGDQARQLEELVGRLEEAVEELERVAKSVRSDVRVVVEALVRSALTEMRRMVDSVNGKLGALERACRSGVKRG